MLTEFYTYYEELSQLQQFRLKNNYICLHSQITIDLLLPTVETLLILILERVQRRATKYILNDFVSSYKSRHITLHLLPLMYLYELNDIMFLIMSLKSPSHSFKIFISFSSSTMRSSAVNKLTHHRPTNTHTQHFYFTRISH